MSPKGVSKRVSQKEVTLFFSSPVAWLFLGSFAAFTLFTFFWVESFFARNIADVRPLFEWMPVLLIFLCATLTMRMWSEERRTGTLEHVLVQPTALWRFVVGKFRACMLLLTLALIATLPLPITVALIAQLDWGPVFAGYLASMLLGACYLSIGLYVSARTDNPIVSLIGSVAICGLLYLLGSDTLTSFFNSDNVSLLRQLGSGSRFTSITRGVIDIRDIFYYLSLTVGFLSLNVYALEKEGWARFASTPRQRHWRIGIVLLIANLIAANIWLAKIDSLRKDLTQGQLYSISQTSRDFLQQLQEPLLIRGYLSTRTHPLLAPLVPQLRDLIDEYATASNGRVRVEFIDPADHPSMETEANERFGIKSSPFQVADRHQSAVVNGYFSLLIQYGNEYQALSFTDLIEARTGTNGQPEVLLRNPEYDITRAVREVLYNYRAGGDLFAGIAKPVEFIGYVSDDSLLPATLIAYKKSISEQLQVAADSSNGTFSFRFIKPESGNGETAKHIEQSWGFSPMSTNLDEENEFFFYLTLADEQQVVRLPPTNFNPATFRSALDTGLKRFASGFTKTVAVSGLKTNNQALGHPANGPSFAHLEAAISRDYRVLDENLNDANVSPEADILVVLAPKMLNKYAVFAIDQFLMRGGTVILATSPFHANVNEDGLHLQPWDSGLTAWLGHHGIEIGKQLVLDKQSALFPAPVIREDQGHTFRDVKIIDYPYFVDIRRAQMGQHPSNGSLPHLTMSWASPIMVERQDNQRVSRLLSSSPQSWLSDSLDIRPTIDKSGRSTVQASSQSNAPLTAHNLGIALQGNFQSFFTQRIASGSDNAGAAAFLQRSPQAARLIVYASNDFLGDRVLSALVTASKSQYLGAVELVSNTLDWALQEEQLLEIRSRAHFNRTLVPMEARARTLIELFNYGLALAWLAVLAILKLLRKQLRRRRFTRELGL